MGNTENDASNIYANIYLTVSKANHLRGNFELCKMQIGFNNFDLMKTFRCNVKVTRNK